MYRRARIGTAPRRLAAGFIVVALAMSAMAGSVVAGHLAEAVKSYTGCLNTGGTLTLIREGETPARTCPSGSTLAHFSGGDITGITVGTGLTGGGKNGSVTVSLDPQYALRQDCADADVVKWNATADAWECADDDDTTYTAGDGLELNGTEFSVDPGFALPDCTLGESATMVSDPTAVFGIWGCQQKADADQDCPTDEFVNGIDEFGGVECDGGSGSGGGATELVEFNQGASFANGVGVPDDGDYRSYASSTLGAGTWLIVAKGTVTLSGVSEGCGSGFCSGGDPAAGHAVCRLMLDGVELDRTDIRVVEGVDNHAYFPFALTNWEATAGGPVAVECGARNADAVGIRNVRAIAVKVD
jgi:hypothetical protein